MVARIVSVLLPGILLTQASAAPVPGPEELGPLLERSRRLIEDAQKAGRPAWLDQNPHQERMRQEALSFSRAQPKPFSGTDKNAGPPARVVVFVSSALGGQRLKDILVSGAGRADVLFVFRGLLPGQKIPDLLETIQGLIGDLDPMPNVALDPTRFREAGIEAVPAMTLETDGGIAAQVAGVTNFDWLKRAVSRGRTGDLGQYGPVTAIAEEDLIEVIARRFAAIDWDAKRRRTVSDYWRRARFERLAAASKDRERRLDPTVVTPRDILAPDGQVIARAGERYNPLDRVAFRQRLVIFDGASPAQVGLAHALGRDAEGRRVTYIATRLPRDRGWEALGRLESRLKAPVYLLTPEIRARFELEYAPATVEADGGRFVVREFKVEKQEGKAVD
ncbi:MAG: hypothetical protein JXJ18_01090 [Rhodobacteraceae bacterium]|nr:hypothetical protein [Paracoccaceae bacterium]